MKRILTVCLVLVAPLGWADKIGVFNGCGVNLTNVFINLNWGSGNAWYGPYNLSPGGQDWSTFGGSIVAGWTYRITANSQPDQTGTVAGGNQAVGYTCGGDGSTNCNRTFLATVKNPTGRSVLGYWAVDGVDVYTNLIPPYASGSYNYSLPCATSYTLTYGTRTLDVGIFQGLSGDYEVAVNPGNSNPEATNNAVNITNSAFAGNLTNVVANANYPSQVSGAYVATNGLINWSNLASGAAQDSTLKAGFGATVEELRNLRTELALNGGAGSGSGTNVSGTASNVWIQNPLLSVSDTNLAQAGTNDQRSGISGLLGGNTWVTNSDGAKTRALAVDGMSGLQGSLTSATGSVETAASTAISRLSDSGDSSALSFTFCGSTLNLDPDYWCPGIMGVIKAGWTFVLLVWFLSWLAGYVWSVVQTAAGAQTGGIPDLEASFLGVGGNLLGLIVAIAVASAVCLLWVGLVGALVAVTVSYASQLSDAAGGLGLLGNSTAFYLLNGSFPVSLAITLGLARITIPLMGSALTVVVAMASRFLFGK